MPRAVTEHGGEYGASQAEYAADLLFEHRLCRKRFGCFPPLLLPPTQQDAYRVQGVLHQYLTSEGWGKTIGYKIGCTTDVMQAYLGIHNPCAGGVFDTTVHMVDGRIECSRFLRLGVECEIAVRLGDDLLPGATPFDRSIVAAAIESCMAAIEVVEDRYVDYAALDAASLIADDFFGAGCVLGVEAEGFDPFELPQVTGRMTINGHDVGSGTGNDILEHPLDALVWLANTMAQGGSGLREGELVLLGSLVQTNWIQAGDEVVVVNEPFGEVRAAFV